MHACWFRIYRLYYTSALFHKPSLCLITCFVATLQRVIITPPDKLSRCLQCWGGNQRLAWKGLSRQANFFFKKRSFHSFYHTSFPSWDLYTTLDDPLVPTTTTHYLSDAIQNQNSFNYNITEKEEADSDTAREAPTEQRRQSLSCSVHMATPSWCSVAHEDLEEPRTNLEGWSEALWSDSR